MTFIATRTPSPLDAIVQDAGRKLLGLQMTRIVGAGDKHDADNLIADLEALAKILDPMFRQFGEYAHNNLGITAKDVDEHFTDVLRSAFEGNGMFAIEEAGAAAQAYLNGMAAE